MEKKSAILRRLLKEEKPLFRVSVGTAHQAQLAERTGFKSV